MDILIVGHVSKYLLSRKMEWLFVHFAQGHIFVIPVSLQVSLFFKIFKFSVHPLPFFSENHLLIILCSSLITVNLWKCQTCRKKYSSQDVSRTPRVYSTCGHTSCEACVESDFTQKKRVVCLTCEGRSGGITGKIKKKRGDIY